uniref:Uncharacterized protein n=1 Tax=Arundo donax TaxID=35708 RepID=A0A0A9BFU5_ARUDO
MEAGSMPDSASFTIFQGQVKVKAKLELSLQQF